MIFDVDGTLVDSNDAHARAWVRAFAEHGIAVAYEPVRRAIGMSGDKLMPRVSGIEEDSTRGALLGFGVGLGRWDSRALATGVTRTTTPTSGMPGWARRIGRSSST